MRMPSTSSCAVFPVDLKPQLEGVTWASEAADTEGWGARWSEQIMPVKMQFRWLIRHSPRFQTMSEQATTTMIDLHHPLSTQKLCHQKCSRQTKELVQRQDETNEVIARTQTPQSTSFDVECTK
jgi:hypothetical protein